MKHGSERASSVFLHAGPTPTTKPRDGPGIFTGVRPFRTPMQLRHLKVEPLDEQCGQPVTKTMIRLKGRWLKRAGFAPGRQIEVICERPGRLILRDANVDHVAALQPASL